MSCNQTVRIHRYHDGESSPDERLEVEVHLADCPQCRELLGDLQSLSTRLRDASTARMPAGLIDRLCRRSAESEERAVLRIAGWLTAAAASILLAAVLSWPTDAPTPLATPATWESVAVRPSLAANDSPNAELLVMAEWMADNLASDRGELR